MRCTPVVDYKFKLNGRFSNLRPRTIDPEETFEACSMNVRSCGESSLFQTPIQASRQ